MAQYQLLQPIFAFSDPSYLKQPADQIRFSQTLNVKSEVSILKIDDFLVTKVKMAFIQYPSRTAFHTFPGESRNPEEGNGTMFAWVPVSWLEPVKL